MRQRAAASLLYQSKYAEAAFRNLLKLIFLKIVGRILAFYTEGGLNAGPVCRTQISRAMEDVMPLILIVVLFVVLKPVVKAILKGMGITDRWRDR